MRKLILYIAMSLDGYIADKDGGISWLEGDGSNLEAAGSYHEFFSNIDTVILGYKTYHQIVTELSPEKWPYSDKQSYVITHNNIPNTANITFTDKDLTSLLYEIRKEPGNDIWLCGGASLVTLSMNNTLIDKYHITVIPTILGDGVKLFDGVTEQKLRLLNTMQYNGMTDLVYEKR